MIHKITLRVQGMNCAACAANITHDLKKARGVIDVNVNFATSKAIIEFDTEEIDITDIKKIIEHLDFKAFEEGGEQMVAGEMSMDDDKNKEKKKWRNRFIASFILGLPILYLAMGEMIGLPIPSMVEQYKILIQVILSTGVILACFGLWRSGLKGLIRLRPNMDSLIFVGTATAYFYSLVVFIMQEMNPPTTEVMMNYYFESAVFILIFISLGKYLEAVTKGKTSEAIKKLMGIAPKEAIILKAKDEKIKGKTFGSDIKVKDLREAKIVITDLEVDDIVVVKPGAKIPVDGIVVNGYSAVDEKVITGESIPVEKKIGDTVIGGTLNKTGIIYFRATKVGSDTMLAQIIKIVEDAMSSKAPIQELADSISFYFVPTVIVIAILAGITWLLLGQPVSFVLGIFVAVMIIACPCALGLATPTAIMMGTGLAAGKGILIKSGDALEIAKKVSVVVFDKTGTLTIGEPKVTNVVELKGSKENLLQIAGSIEKNSEHPLAQAIVDEVKKQKIKFLDVKNFSAVPGKGVEGSVGTKKVLLGTRLLMTENKIDTKKIEGKLVELENQGKTAMILAIDKEITGIIAVADTLKKNSKQAIEMLKKMGKKVAIITGDNRRVATAVAKELSIDVVISEVLPQDKANEVKKLQSKGEVVAMVGDGINDAPALAQAELGIALGSGTDVAMETGKIILVKDDLRDVAHAIKLSGYTLTKIKQGLFWAFFYNVVGIPIAAGVLFPFTGWLLSPSIAGAAMAFSSVSVVLNALAMKRYKSN